mmetsp:Transcript_24956/g.46007  ORF Transcript_24956/g.46007 Transcript_24956/m.46007 type:complete len:85 (-) Transcript_24956:390-644(-)
MVYVFTFVPLASRVIENAKRKSCFQAKKSQFVFVLKDFSHVIQIIVARFKMPFSQYGSVAMKNVVSRFVSRIWKGLECLPVLIR